MSNPSKLRIAGSWSGTLEADFSVWTVSSLRAEVWRRSGAVGAPDQVKLITGGKILKDDPEATLEAVGLRNNAKILASRVEPARGMADEERRAKEVEIGEEERARRLARIRVVTEKMAGRNIDGSVPVEDHNIELEDQNGQKVKFGTENDQRGLMMGLMLHANGKRLIKNQKYKDALDVLAMGEESFSLCDPKITEMIDNVPILQIDTVWCYFMLRDISWLSMAGVRLANARKGIERSHGKDSNRFRLLQAGRHAEVAIHLRLELLEGVVAYHTGDIEKARKTLSSAQTKYLQLQVPDEALSLLLSMGYKEQSAKRALRMNNQDVSAAIDLLVEEKARKTQRRQEDIKRRKEIKEQQSYGTTPQKKAVDIQKLDELVSIGFERSLAAEALRVNENDTQKALDDLTNPETNSKLQLRLDGQKKLREAQPNQGDIDTITSMGYARSDVVAALREAGTVDAATNMLMSMGHGENLSNQVDVASSSAPSTVNSDEANSEPNGNRSKQEERDLEMEDEIASELTGDPLADYDIEVSKEGEAIAEYLSMVG